MSGLDSELIRYAIDTARQRGYKRVKIKQGDDSFSATLSAEPTENDSDEGSGETIVEQLSIEPVETRIEAPAVGYFRATEPPLTLGALLSAGDKVGEIVALGLANDISTKVDGEIIEVCVEDGEAVEYGQSILKVRQTV